MAAHDACMNFIRCNHIDIVCISEPYKIEDTYQWIGTRKGSAAIYWNP